MDGLVSAHFVRKRNILSNKKVLDKGRAIQFFYILDAAATPSSLQAYSFAGSVDIAGSINNK